MDSGTATVINVFKWIAFQYLFEHEVVNLRVAMDHDFELPEVLVLLNIMENSQQEFGELF